MSKYYTEEGIEIFPRINKYHSPILDDKEVIYEIHVGKYRSTFYKWYMTLDGISGYVVYRHQLPKPIQLLLLLRAYE